MDQITVTDRYDALGILPPSPWTVCRGQCEGTGAVPVYMQAGDRRENHGLVPADEDDERLVRLWREAEARNPSQDGWHFVRCPDCDGSGRRVTGRLGQVLDLLHTYWYPLRFAVWSVMHRFEDQSLRDAALDAPRIFAWMWRRQAHLRAARGGVR